MACGCSNCGCDSYDAIAGLGRLGASFGLGAIPQQMAAIAGGGPFAFGYNTGYFRGELYKVEDIAKVLEDSALAYDARSYHVAGYLNPYVTIEGNAVTQWDNAADFGQAIYNAVAGAGYPIDYGSIQFRAEPFYPQGAQTPPPRPLVGTPYPTTTPGIFTSSGACDFKTMGLPNWLACQLGVTPTTAVVVGAIGALIVVAAIGRR